jgi:hypothetical protein
VSTGAELDGIAGINNYGRAVLRPSSVAHGLDRQAVSKGHGGKAVIIEAKLTHPSSLIVVVRLL